MNCRQLLKIWCPIHYSKNRKSHLSSHCDIPPFPTGQDTQRNSYARAPTKKLNCSMVTKRNLSAPRTNFLSSGEMTNLEHFFRHYWWLKTDGRYFYSLLKDQLFAGIGQLGLRWISTLNWKRKWSSVSPTTRTVIFLTQNISKINALRALSTGRPSWSGSAQQQGNWGKRKSDWRRWWSDIRDQ